MSDLCSKNETVDSSIVDNHVNEQYMNGNHVDISHIEDLDVVKDNRLDNVNETAGDSVTVPFPFLSLPPEIRLQIYRDVLVAEDPLRPLIETLTPPPIPHSEHACHPGNPDDLSILRVCRQINAEASEILYHENVFRFTIPPYQVPARELSFHGDAVRFAIPLFQDRPTPPKMNQLADIYHVSLYYLHPEDGRDVDATIATHLRHVIQNCPLLQTFTLHLQSEAPSNFWLVQLLKPTAMVQRYLNAQGDLAEATTLAALGDLLRTVRDKLTIVVQGPGHCFGPMRLDIAPSIQWEPEGKDKWRGVSVRQWSSATMGLRPKEELRGWTFRTKNVRRKTRDLF